MKHWRLPPPVVLLAILVVLPANAAALCVTSGTPCREYAAVPVIFQGVVERITPIDEYPDRYFGSMPAQLVHVRVERVWKGLKDVTAVDLVTLGGRGRWVEDEFTFEINQRYVIWARPSETGTTLRTNACSRTRPLKDAAEDIEFLESLSQPASGGFVYGKVWLSERTLSPAFKPEALKDATVVVEGMGTRRETRTDASGHYRFSGLPPGSYDVSVVLQEHLAARRVDYADAHAPVHETPVRSAVVIDGPRDCAEASFWIQSNGSISGFASVEGGRPVDGVVVLAALVDEVRRTDAARELGRFSYLFSGKAVTGADGSFEFTNLPPGRYVVGVSLEHDIAADHPYPRTFYPGVAVLEDATVVELQRGEQLQIGNLTLSAPLTQTIVQGSVVGMDGQPAVGAQVVAVNNRGASAGSMFTKEDGRFRLTLYSNHSYRLRAMLRDKQGAIVAETTRQLDAPEGAGEPLRLVLKAPVAK
jgi:uncharacterized protein (DUF2141 family)